MSEKFYRAQKFVDKWEGGLSDDKYDAGGITKYGVSLAFLRDLPKARLDQAKIEKPITKDTIKNLTRQQASDLFLFNFWLPCAGDDLPEPMGLLLYDFAINCGLHTAIRKMQSYCNLLGDTLAVDGWIGGQTIGALTKHRNKKDIQFFIEQRKKYYYLICAKKKTQLKFIRGWINRCEDLEREALKYVTG